MLLPDEENLPVWLRAELDALREARGRLSARARSYLRALAVRAMVTREALEMLASGDGGSRGRAVTPPPSSG